MVGLCAAGCCPEHHFLDESLLRYWGSHQAEETAPAVDLVENVVSDELCDVSGLVHCKICVEQFGAVGLRFLVVLVLAVVEVEGGICSSSGSSVGGVGRHGHGSLAFERCCTVTAMDIADGFCGAAAAVRFLGVTHSN